MNRKRMFLPIFSLLTFFLLPLAMHAAVPSTVNYQGMLYDSSSNPITSTSPGVNIDFYIYDAQTAGTLLWSDSQAGISVSNGLFNTRLGSTLNPLSASLFTGASAWLEIAVNGDPPMTPRQEITSVIFALRSGEADVAIFAIDADKVDGYDAADLEESVEIVNAVTAHKNLPSDHHTKTTSFADLTDTASDLQIPAGVARDTEIMPTVLANDGIGSGLDAALLGGQDPAAFAAYGHNHDTSYYSKAYVDTLESRIAALEAKFTHFSTVGNEVTISGANVNIVNGTGTTDGAVNGLGNLVVGYNELRTVGDDRTGSHNIIAGKNNNFSSYGGLVAGLHNTISGIYAAVSAGTTNIASGDYSSVSGGRINTASDIASSVSGGYSNSASSSYSSVSGGSSNTASGYRSSVSGGFANTASGDQSSVSGGFANTASGDQSSVSGGFANTASGAQSSVSGGGYNQAQGSYSSVAGGGGTVFTDGNKAFANFSSVLGGTTNVAGDPLFVNATIGEQSTVSGGSNNNASGPTSSVIGGTLNTASGTSSAVSGGEYNKAVGDYSSVAGGGGSTVVDGNTAFANYSAVLGGAVNIAGDPLLASNTIGEHSTVSGGSRNTASGRASSVSGGDSNIASSLGSSVSGGFSNTASGNQSSVSGGGINTASGDESSIIGGLGNTASGIQSSVSGGHYNQAMGDRSSVVGGGGVSPADGNKAVGQFSSILGGTGNIAGDPLLSDNTIGINSTVSGGRFNKASGAYSSVAGGGGNVDTLGNRAFANYSAVLGGYSNIAGDPTLSSATVGEKSTISGGGNNNAKSLASSVSGGSNNNATGINSSVTGGNGNNASGYTSTVSGGTANTATDFHSSVSGGYNNTASASASSVSGGVGNSASGQYSSVSGGQNDSVSGIYDWRAGDIYFATQ